MSNLGYFQLKANPGVWNLSIREDRGSEVLEMVSIGATGLESNSVVAAGSEVAISTFRGATIYPRFRRRPGKETVDLLDDTGERLSKSEGLFSKLRSMCVC